MPAAKTPGTMILSTRTTPGPNIWKSTPKRMVVQRSRYGTWNAIWATPPTRKPATSA
jgi:hypothetical protein